MKVTFTEKLGKFSSLHLFYLAHCINIPNALVVIKIEGTKFPCLTRSGESGLKLGLAPPPAKSSASMQLRLHIIGTYNMPTFHKQRCT
jgi:hypothetical protein